jgi:hypothetical protein
MAVKKEFALEDVKIKETISTKDSKVILIRVPSKFNPTSLLKDAALLSALTSNSPGQSIPIPNTNGMTLDSLTPDSISELDSLNIHLPNKNGSWKMVNKAKNPPSFFSIGLASKAVDDRAEMERVGREILEAPFCAPKQIRMLVSNLKVAGAQKEIFVDGKVKKEEEGKKSKKAKKEKKRKVVEDAQSVIEMPQKKKKKKEVKLEVV